jgi:hypothetical protein
MGEVNKIDLSTWRWRMRLGGFSQPSLSTHVRGLLGVCLAVLAAITVVPTAEAEDGSTSRDHGFLAGGYFALRLGASDAHAEGSDWESLKRYYLQPSEASASTAGAETGVTAASSDYGFLAGGYYALRFGASDAHEDGSDWESLQQYYVHQPQKSASATRAKTEIRTASSDYGFLAGSYFALRLGASDAHADGGDWESLKRYYL